MATIEDIKKLLETKSFTSARDLNEFEEKVDEVNEAKIHLNCDPAIGMTNKDGNILLKSLNFSKAWNSLGKEISIKQGNVFPLGQGDMLDIDTGISASFPDGAVGMVMLLPSFTGTTGLTLVGSPFVMSGENNIVIRITNVRKDMTLVEKDAPVANLIVVGKIKADVLETYNKD